MIAELEEKEQELKEVKGSLLYAYAMGSGCGYCPTEHSYRKIRERVERLNREIYIEKFKLELGL